MNYDFGRLLHLDQIKFAGKAGGFQQAFYQELQRQFIEGTIEEGDLDELRELNEIWSREYGRLSERAARGGARLEDIIDHPALFRAYPQLRRVQVEFAEMEDGVRGSYSGAENKITLAADLRTAPEETLIHEIQHAIQRTEGFARGSNRQYWENRLVNGDEIYSLGFGEAREALEQFEADPENAEAMKMKDRLEQAGELDDDLETYDSIWAEAEQRGLDGKINEYYELRDNYYTQRNRPGNSVPSELYYNTAGEIEARDAADRRHMSPWTRNMLAPDYGSPDTVFAEDDIDYAAETDSIKEQLREHQDELLDMEPAAEVNTPPMRNWKMSRLRAWVINELRPTGFRVDRKDFGTIIFDEKRLNTSLDYLRPGDAEAAAYAALPRVLKRGIEISGHENHKGREYGTITIAAPVILNGQRGNMAVVVKRTSKNFYKMHRVLTPDGTLFVLPDEMANAEPTSGGGVTETGSLATPISSASEDSITQNNAESKGEIQDEGPAELSLPTLEEESSPDIRFSISERQDKQEIIQNLRGILDRGGSAADLRRYVDTLDGRTEPEADTDAAAEIVRTAHNEGVSVDEYLRQNWESYEYDGELNADARRALELERRQSRRRYSVSEDGASEVQVDDTISSLPSKAQQYLRRTERYLLDKVSALLSVPRYARREFLQDIVREISVEYLQTGTVSQQAIDDLFERAYDEGIEVDSEYYDTYKGIKDHLRTQPITLAEQDKTNIADWGDFRKSTFGTLRIVNDGGLPVDVAYMELQSMAPELFPEDIIHPADQLVRMFEVGRSIQRAEKSLDEVYGHDAEEFKRWAKNDFDAAVNEVLGELRQVKRFADERAQQTETESTLTQEQVAAMYGQLKEARRTYEKAAAKNLLTQHDEIQVGRLLRGEIELEHLDPAKDNVKGITAVYEAKREYERLTRSIREWNQRRKTQLRELADGFALIS